MTNCIILSLTLLTGQPATNNFNASGWSVSSNLCWTAVVRAAVTNAGQWRLTYLSDGLPKTPITTTNLITGVVTTNGWRGADPIPFGQTKTSTGPAMIVWAESVPKFTPANWPGMIRVKGQQ